MTVITSIEALEALYDTPGEASLVKEADRITPPYRRLIEASPFVALATCGPAGLDCSPRGELGGVVHIEDERTPLQPDRRGNNRNDPLTTVVRDTPVSLLLLIPGPASTRPADGPACLTSAAALPQPF